MDRIANLDLFLMEDSQEMGRRERFQEAIQALSDESGGGISTDWDDYNRFEIALILGEKNRYKSLIVKGEWLEITPSSSMMIRLLAKKGDYETALVLFKKMPIDEQRKVLFAVEKEDFALLDFLWGDVPEELQGEKWPLFRETPDVVIPLFQKSTDAVQKLVCLHYLADGPNALAIKLWQIARPSVKESLVSYRDEGGHSILSRAIVAKNLELIPYLIEDVRFVQSEDEEGWTPLRRALEIKKEIGNELLEQIREKDDGFTAEFIFLDRKEKFQKIAAGFRGNLSKNWDDYSSFQIAVLLNEKEEYARLSLEDGLGEIKENTLPLLSMLFILASRLSPESQPEGEDYEALIYLFKKIADSNKEAFLFCGASKCPSLLVFLWDHCSEGLQENLLLRFWEKPDILMQFFQRSADSVQKKTCLNYLRSNSPFPQGFSCLWEKARPSVKESLILYRNELGFSILMSAICNGNREAIVTLLRDTDLIHIFTIKGRLTPLEYAINLEKKLGPELVEIIREKDGGFTDEIILCRLLGHALGLQGDLFEIGIISTKDSFVLETAVETMHGPSKTILNYAGIIEVLECCEKDLKLLAKRALSLPTLISSGWESHAVKCIFFGDICVKIDTGVSEMRGMRFYKIHKKEGLEEAIAGLQRIDKDLAPQGIGALFLNETLDQILSLEIVGYIPCNQIGSSCCFSSLREAILVLFYLEEVKNRGLELNIRALRECSQSVENRFLVYKLFWFTSIFKRVVSMSEKEYAKVPELQSALTQLDIAYEAFCARVTS